MRAVFKHELSSYFTGLTAYVFGAFLLLFAGIYTMAYNLTNQMTNFEYVLGSMSFVYIVAVPILTMRVLAEERKQKTDQLLYSLPLTMTKVILGKYAAMLVMLLIPTAIMCLYPMLLSAYGNISLVTCFSAVLAFVLLGAALLSIGMFVSSVTESQPIAAGLCLVVMLVNYFMADLSNFVTTEPIASFWAFTVIVLALAAVVWLMTKNLIAALVSGTVLEAALAGIYLYNSSLFEGLFPGLMKELSLFSRFNGFIDGVFDLTSVVYFVSVSGIFVFLSVQSMEKRRWSE